MGNDLYYVSDTGVLSLADATSGQVLWQQRLGGNYSASPVFADGRIYFQSEEGVDDRHRSRPRVPPARRQRLDGATLASMAVSSGSFFIRSHTHLYRIAERK